MSYGNFSAAVAPFDFNGTVEVIGIKNSFSMAELHPGIEDF